MAKKKAGKKLKKAKKIRNTKPLTVSRLMDKVSPM